MINADFFETFYLVAELGSITGAAKKLFVTKTAVSLQIKKLEQLIGTDLFMRVNQRVKLTENGILLFNQCKKLQQELHETRLVCKRFFSYPEGTLKVTAFEYFANKLIFPRVVEFNNLYPKIQLVIDISEDMPDFSGGKTDIAIGFASPPPDEELIQRTLCKTNYVLCGSPEYFAQYSYPNELTELLEHKYICHENRVVSKQIIKLQANYDLDIKPYLVLNKVSSMVECALNGIGIVQIPNYLAKQYLDSGRLVAIFPEYQAVDRDIYYFYSKFRYVEPKIRSFIDFFFADLSTLSL